MRDRESPPDIENIEKSQLLSRLSEFGLKDQEMIEKVLNFGTIIGSEVWDDHIEIFYEKGKFDKIAVRKSETISIDPIKKTEIGRKMHYYIDTESQHRFPIYSNQDISGRRKGPNDRVLVTNTKSEQ